MKIVTIGAAMRDMFLEHDNLQTIQVKSRGSSYPCIVIPEGRKIEIQNLRSAIGGGALNSALSFCKLGFKTTAFFKIGADAEGTSLLAQLHAHTINTSHHAVAEKVHTGISCIIPSSSGDRGVLVFRGANNTLQKTDIPYKALDTCDQLYITSLSGQTSHLLPLITAHAKKHKKRVACNPGTSQLTANVSTLITSLKNIDILITNSFEASLLMLSLGVQKTKAQARKKKNLPDLLAAPIKSPHGSYTLQKYFNALLSHGPKIVVVTDGARGVYVTDGTRIYYHPSVPVDVISSVGAGDAFGSMFVGQLCLGKSIEYALRAGIVNSASVIQSVDANSGQLTRKQVDVLVKKLPNRIQIFDLN